MRYYERRGIPPETERMAAGYRQYNGEALARVRFIRRAHLGRRGLKLAAQTFSQDVAKLSCCA